MSTDKTTRDLLLRHETFDFDVDVLEKIGGFGRYQILYWVIGGLSE